MQKLAYASMGIALALIYVPRLIVVLAQSKQPEGFDNSHPRMQQAKLTGWGARAQGAHQNGFEAFAPFAAGILACQISGQDVATTAWLGVAFVVVRAVYIAMYVANLATLRSLVWFVAFGIVVALLIRPVIN